MTTVFALQIVLKAECTNCLFFCFRLILKVEFIIDKWTLQQRALIVELYFRNGCSVACAQHEFRRARGVRIAPTDKAIRRWVTAFWQTDSVADAKGWGRPRSVRTAGNIVAVPEEVVQMAIPWNADFRDFTVQIMKKNNGCYPYRVQVVHKLLPTNAHAHLTFAQRFLEMTNNDNNFLTDLMSDKAHFHMDGFTNKHTIAESGQLRTWWLFMIKNYTPACHSLVWDMLNKCDWSLLFQGLKRYRSTWSRAHDSESPK